LRRHPTTHSSAPRSKAAQKRADELKAQTEAAQKKFDAAKGREAAARKTYEAAVDAVDKIPPPAGKTK
jgi:hypothetical protein